MSGCGAASSRILSHLSTQELGLTLHSAEVHCLMPAQGCSRCCPAASCRLVVATFVCSLSPGQVGTLQSPAVGLRIDALSLSHILPLSSLHCCSPEWQENFQQPLRKPKSLSLDPCPNELFRFHTEEGLYILARSLRSRDLLLGTFSPTFAAWWGSSEIDFTSTQKISGTCKKRWSPTTSLHSMATNGTKSKQIPKECRVFAPVVTLRPTHLSEFVGVGAATGGAKINSRDPSLYELLIFRAA